MEYGYEKEYTDDNPDFSPSGFYCPFEVMSSDDLSQTDKHVFSIISSLSNNNKGCWASNQYIANIVRVSKSSVSKSVSNLEKFNFVYSKSKQNRDGSYTRFIQIEPEYMTYAQRKRLGLESRPPSKKRIGGSEKTERDINIYNNSLIKPKKPFSEKTLSSDNSKSFTVFNKMINQSVETRSEQIAAYYFNVFESVNGKHPSVSDEQMINGLANIEKYMVSKDYDNDRIIEIISDFFRSKVLLQSGVDFKWNLFTSERVLKARCREREETDEI